jgi:hypothetical protein
MKEKTRAERRELRTRIRIYKQLITIAVQPTASVPPISEERLDEIVAAAVKEIRREAAKTERSRSRYSWLENKENRR